MQNEKSTLAANANTAPVEIDASLLHLVSGGAPKNTWNEPAAEAAAMATSEPDTSTSAPKNTW